MTNDQHSDWPFYLLAFSIFLTLVSPHLLSDGMFLDGTIYATISRNLAEGFGGLWTPYYTGPPGTVFYEHPPFAFWLQSVFYAIFGDSIYVERVYSFMTFILTGFIMTRIWRHTVKKEFAGIAWLPLFLFAITPTVFWAATNNVLENTMMIFTSGAVYFYLCDRQGKYHFLFLGISGASLALGFLTKGFTSLFILSLPFWIWLIKKDISFLKMATDSLVLVVFTGLPLFILIKIDSAAYDHLSFYIDHQVVNSIQNAKTVESRFDILRFWLNDILPPFIFACLIFWLAIKKSIVEWVTVRKNRQWSLVFFLLGLSGVLPIMITLKQSSFYILPTFVFFSLSLALLISPALTGLLFRLKSYQKIKWISMGLFIAAATYAITQAGTIGRDRDELNDVFRIIRVVPEGSMVSISPDLAGKWALYAQFARYGHISLDTNSQLPYLVVIKGSNEVPVNYKKVELQTSQYELYEKF